MARRVTTSPAPDEQHEQLRDECDHPMVSVRGGPACWRACDPRLGMANDDGLADGVVEMAERARRDHEDEWAAMLFRVPGLLSLELRKEKGGMKVHDR